MMNTDTFRLDDIVESIDINEASEKMNINVDNIINDKTLAQHGIEKGSKLEKACITFKNILSKIVADYSTNKIGDLVDELLVGQFKSSLIDIFKKEHLDQLDDDEAQNEYNELKKNANFVRGEDQSELYSRKDSETNTSIDSESVKAGALWYSNDKEYDLGKQLSDLVAEIQKAAQTLKTERQNISDKLKQMKVDVTDEELSNFGPLLQKCIEDKLSADEIRKKLENAKKSVNESYHRKVNYLRSSVMLTEGRFILTEDIKNRIMTESIIESDYFAEYIYRTLVNEGLISGMFTKVKDKIKDLSKKTLKVLTNKTLSGIVSMIGLGISIFTGGLAGALALRAIYAVERHGKRLKNAFERQFTRYANSKGVIAVMEFSLADKPDSKYAARFYEKDMVWRVLNLNDQLKHPSKEYSKSILNGETGKKFRNRLAEIWNPMFDKSKGGKIDFVELFNQAKNVNISEKALKQYQNFAQNYDKIKANCIDTIVVDTRTQTLSKDKLDT